MLSFCHQHFKNILAILFCFALLAMASDTYAQKKSDTAGKVPVIIKNEKLFVHVKTDSGEIDKFIGDVQFQQGETNLYCDSAYMRGSNIEAFGNARITQADGTQAQSDYMRYTSSDKMAYMKGNVSLTDGKSKLWCEELTYNVATKTGVYTNGGTLQDSTTTVSSNAGTYNTHTKDARFTGDVLVSDPQYQATSGDMGFNTETKLVTFFNSPSVVTSDKSVLHTSVGTYDSKRQIAHFTGRSSVINDDQYLEADKLDYDKTIGFGKALGNVVAIDTTQHTTLYSGYAEYYRNRRVLWATIKPVLKQVTGKDSLFIRADSFYSAPVPKRKDTLLNNGLKQMRSETIHKGKNKRQLNAVPMADTTVADSTSPRYFIGYHHVLIFSDSLQGRCDSVSYSQADSVIRMMYNPVAWSRNSQITGDTILLKMDSNKLKRIYVPNNALVVSLSGPPASGMYDQVQGKTLRGDFVNNNITYMLVKPNAESIYYSKDDAGAYLGVNQAQSERMKVFFVDRKISKILFEQEVHQTMTPIEQADIGATRLSRFKWLIEKRPKSREELFQ
ncbi:MAG: hypothetical protein H0X33_06265 [Taibaiella sp.]|nr:hypothetical protein [Taibaiella sp.]